MATSTLTAAPTQTTDAEFRTWCQAVHDSLAAVGLVQTADTGQINLTTVAKPSAGSQTAGYEIWKFNDSLQTTKPIFIRIEYGSGSAATTPKLGARVGTTTDGAGSVNASGTYMNGVRVSYNSMTASTTARTIYASGDQTQGYVILSVWPGAHDGAQNFEFFTLIVERTRDNTGATTGEAVLVAAGHGQAASNHQMHVLRYDIAGSKSYNGTFYAPYQDSSHTLGADVFFCPLFQEGPSGEYKLYGPLFSALVYWYADITRDTNVSVTHYGVSRTFKCLGQWATNVVYPVSSNTQSPQGGLAVRFD